MAKNSNDDEYDKEAQDRFEAALRFGLKTPPGKLLEGQAEEESQEQGERQLRRVELPFTRPRCPNKGMGDVNGQEGKKG